MRYRENTQFLILNSSDHLGFSTYNAFQVAENPADIEDPPGGEWTRDKDGNLSGRMKNMAVFITVIQVNPVMEDFGPAEASLNCVTSTRTQGSRPAVGSCSGPFPMVSVMPRSCKLPPPPEG